MGYLYLAQEDNGEFLGCQSCRGNEVSHLSQQADNDDVLIRLPMTFALRWRSDVVGGGVGPRTERDWERLKGSLS